jgi:hypothetical protein
LKIHEITKPDGTLADVSLEVTAGAAAIRAGDEALVLPDGAFDAVMSRFGEPFDPASRFDVLATLDLGGGKHLRHVRHLAGYDVIARDYIVYEAAGVPPLCALATTVAGALEHLGRAAARGPVSRDH